MNDARTLYEGKWLRMVARGHWEYVERTHADGMAVIIIAVTPDDDVLFVEQISRSAAASARSRCPRGWSATTSPAIRWKTPPDAN